MPERTDQPPEQPTPAPCTDCNGSGGIVETTTADGVLRQTWHGCKPCGGTGRA
ncbi:hypothetical protein ABT063_24700 [Streptomyces sp. NPDC002838]|uniref:hypothetical protein n=1 Tax=Streptomyces sp. NPDC002838 TaxID=3154436 RepID=UPI00331939E3